MGADSLLGDLKLKRERENGEAERHRRRRDDLNDKTREWVDRRDALNAQVRAYVEEATQHRIKRDELNAQVRAAKEERDVWNRKVNELLDQLGDLKRRKMPRGAVPLSKLKRDLKALEFRQMTSVLTVDKERALIEEMAKLQAEIRRLEKSLDENEEVRKVAAELKETREKAEAAHRTVSQLAEQAQAEHDAMSALYEKGDETRREADLAQEEFIKTKMLADEEHRKHIEHIREVHDYDKIIHGIWMKERGTAGEGAEVDAKKEAELIFEKFKKGEKLSTDDLMTLQKSGYL
ncbi:MAG: phosphoserine phosphatase [Euryarchaeota archaeon RBG_16_68_13]|nr:MAG: phosphoserine phosphatase [Euryarchaeota archaeon RBG_16_68_13]